MTTQHAIRLFLAAYDLEDRATMDALRPALRLDHTYRHEVEHWLQQHEAQAILPGDN